MIVLSGEEGRAGTSSPQLVLPPAVHGTDWLAHGLLQPNGREDARAPAIGLSPAIGMFYPHTRVGCLSQGKAWLPPRWVSMGGPTQPPLSRRYFKSNASMGIRTWDEGEIFFHQAGNLIHCSSGVPGSLSSSMTMIISSPNGLETQGCPQKTIA